MRAAIIPTNHDLRPSAEQLIAEVYALRYAARITTFPATLIGMTSDRDTLLCAAGLRFAFDGFFSECYLDAPVDAMLSGLSRSPVCRELVFEVTSLASRSPHVVGSFLRKIISRGEAAGFEWAFFTATAPLKALLERIGLPLVPLATADRARVANPESWGTYYQLAPTVYAVHRDLVGACMGREMRVAANG